MNGFGARIQSLRRRSGLTQQRLAELLGVSNKAVSKWECGVTAPDISMIVPLARVLQVSTDELLGMASTPTESAREKYERAYHQYKDGADPAAGYWWAREAVSAFPGDFRYTLWLADTEYRLAFAENSVPGGQAEYLDDCTDNALRRYENIIETCADPEIVRQAVLGKIRVLRFCERIVEADWCAQFEYPDPTVHTAEEALRLNRDGRQLLEYLAGEQPTKTK